MTPEEKLKSRGYDLTKPAAPAANYIPVSRVGKTIYVSGQISAGPDGVIKGHLGRDLDVAAGQKAAERCAVALMTQMVHGGGTSLDKVRILKLTVLVASVPEFSEQHLVANGASDLFVDILGEKGRHARAAFGVAALPLGAAVEIEAIAEIED